MEKYTILNNIGGNMSNERYALSECPFCGCGCAEIIPVDMIEEYFIRCGQCRAMSRLCKSEGAAAALWNKRAKPKS